jgi:voltage-gated sodium channel
LHLFLEGSVFNNLIFAAILANAVIIGADVQMRADDNPMPDVFSIADDVFVVIFSLEAVLKIGSNRWVYFFDQYNVFDFILVIGSLIDKAAAGQDTHIMLFRVLRLCRLLRLLRTVRFFRELRMLVLSLFLGLRSLFWAMLLLAMFTYIVAVLLTDTMLQVNLDTLPTERMEKFNFYVDDAERFLEFYFGGVDKSMLTLFQVMTLESWTNGIARPADALSPNVMFIFLFYVWVITYGLLNMVIGVFVEHSVATAAADAEYKVAQKREEFEQNLQALKELFLETDADGSGELSLDEFQAMKTDQRLQLIMAELADMDEDEFFEALDLDGEGSVSIDEFIKGTIRAQGQPTSLDVFIVKGNLLKVQELLADEVRDRKAKDLHIEAQVASLADAQRTILSTVDALFAGMLPEQHARELARRERIQKMAGPPPAAPRVHPTENGGEIPSDDDRPLEVNV